MKKNFFLVCLFFYSTLNYGMEPYIDEDYTVDSTASNSQRSAQVAWLWKIFGAGTSLTAAVTLEALVFYKYTDIDPLVLFTGSVFGLSVGIVSCCIFRSCEMAKTFSQCCKKNNSIRYQDGEGEVDGYQTSEEFSQEYFSKKIKPRKK